MYKLLMEENSFFCDEVKNLRLFVIDFKEIIVNLEIEKVSFIILI